MNIVRDIWLIFLATCLLPVFVSGQEREDWVLVTGQILDRDSGLPLELVRVVSADGFSGTITDPEGRFSLKVVSPDSVSLILDRIGYQTSHVTVAIPHGNPLHIRLIPTILEIVEDLTVTAARMPESAFQVPALVSIVSRSTIQARNIRQTPELLRETAGITVQKTNQGGGSPRIRGLKANKLLFLIDGIRMNNATYRGGNFQYLNTIDPESLERVEVVHGPNSVMYGSDALGGVINALTVTPPFRHTPGPGISAGMSSRVSSADETHSHNGFVSMSRQNWSARFSGGMRSYGDVTRGRQGGEDLMRRLSNDSRTNRILNTTQKPNGYDAYDFTGKIRGRLTDSQSVTVGYQGSLQNAVPRYDVVETLSDSIRTFDPQTRNLAYARYVKTSSGLWYNNLTATVSWHRQYERRFRNRFGSQDVSVDQFGTDTYGMQLHFNKITGRNHRLVFGTDAYLDDVSSRSYIEVTPTRVQIWRPPLFPDGSTFFSNGFFVQDEWRPRPSLAVTPGVRFAYSRLRAPFPSGFAGPLSFGDIKQASTALTGSLGLVFEVNHQVRWVANIGQGFRTPNLDDVSKLGSGKGGVIFEVPNRHVIPEKSLSIDSGVKIHSTRVKGNFIAFHNRIRDLLIRRPAFLNGRSTVIDSGDTLAVFSKVNAGKAITYGLSANLALNAYGPLSVSASLGYTRGRSVTNREPLTGIPPLNGSFGIAWKTDRYMLESTVRYSAGQFRLSAEDVLDLRIPEGGTPGWYTVGARGSLNAGAQVKIHVAIENIMDLNYREHSSGLNSPGRNFILGLSLRYK